MNCLCCGKPIRSSQCRSGWHIACIQRFFGTEELPDLELNDETLQLLAEKNVKSGYTVPGVQKKLSLHLSREEKSRLTLVDYPNGYILKPQVQEFEMLPESEHLVMLMAESSGLTVVPHALMEMNGTYAYITKRIDRDLSGQTPGIFAMEDFCQLSLRMTADKYKGSYEQCAKVISQYSSSPGLDLSELYLRLVFCFLTGNSDMHLKNFSMIETAPASGKYILSPAYDLLPVNVIMPEDREQFALQMNGKKSKLRKKHFLAFANTIGINQHAAEAMIRAMLGKTQRWINMCEESLLSPDMKTRFKELIIMRAENLEQESPIPRTRPRII